MFHVEHFAFCTRYLVLGTELFHLEHFSNLKGRTNVDHHHG